MRTCTVRAAVAALAAAVATGVAGCSGADRNDLPAGHHSSPPAARASASGTAHTFNDQDVRFAQSMIPHHRQAIEMSDLILAKTDVDPQITELAEQIKSAQGPEITTMTDWLTAWGAEPSPSPTGHDGHDGHDMGGDMGGDGGMLSQAEMAALDKATGDEAARLFLSGMIKHHEGAIAMAEAESRSGQNPDARKLARTIVESQQAEITTMTELLDRL